MTLSQEASFKFLLFYAVGYYLFIVGLAFFVEVASRIFALGRLESKHRVKDCNFVKPYLVISDYTSF